LRSNHFQNNGYNYTAYFTGGGKLLHYVGLADPVISPGNSVRGLQECVDKTLMTIFRQYNTYNSISAFTTANTNLNVDDHYRFYTVPGCLFLVFSQHDPSTLMRIYLE
jgi:feruloyl esterase